MEYELVARPASVDTRGNDGLGKYQRLWDAMRATLDEPGKSICIGPSEGSMPIHGAMVQRALREPGRPKVRSRTVAFKRYLWLEPR